MSDRRGTVKRDKKEKSKTKRGGRGGDRSFSEAACENVSFGEIMSNIDKHINKVPINNYHTDCDDLKISSQTANNVEINTGESLENEDCEDDGMSYQIQRRKIE